MCIKSYKHIQGTTVQHRPANFQELLRTPKISAYGKNRSAEWSFLNQRMDLKLVVALLIHQISLVSMPASASFKLSSFSFNI